MSVPAAGIALGLSRSQAYNWAADGRLTTVADSSGRLRVQRDEVERLRTHPPSGTRAARLQEVDAPIMHLAADLDSRVRALGVQVTELHDAVVGAGIEVTKSSGTPQVHSVSAESQTLTEVRRRLHGARDAIAQLTAVGALYEEAMAEQDRAAALERDAAAHRDNATRALRQLVASYRSALSAATAAVDVEDLAGGG